MTNLRKRAYGLYPHLNRSKNRYAKKAKVRLDLALTDSRGILDINHPKARELSGACDYAQTILNNG